MNVVNCEQGSPEWFAARCGSLGASDIGNVMARTKSGYSASRANLMARLVCERLTGTTAKSFENDAMRWGKEHEADARAAYAFLKDVDVIEVGMVKHPVLAFTHASPDGLVGDDGLVEIKCAQTAQHIDWLLSESISQEYLLQMQWQMHVIDRKWCDFFAWDPRMPAHMQVFCKRVYRDDAQITEILIEVKKFLAEAAEKVMALHTKYPQEIAA